MSLTKNSGSSHGAARKILQRGRKVTKQGTAQILRPRKFSKNTLVHELPLNCIRWSRRVL